MSDESGDSENGRFLAHFWAKKRAKNAYFCSPGKIFSKFPAEKQVSAIYIYIYIYMGAAHRFTNIFGILCHIFQEKVPKIASQKTFLAIFYPCL